VIAVSNSADLQGQFSDQESADSGTASCEAEGGHFEHMFLQSKSRVCKIMCNSYVSIPVIINAL
jgi:hypothetical protein